MGQYNAELENRVIAAAQKRIAGLKTAEDYSRIIENIEREAAETCEPGVYAGITALPVTRSMLGDGKKPAGNCIDELRNAYMRLERIRYYATGIMPSL